jgi:deoxycytidine triphosphate deaminase
MGILTKADLHRRIEAGELISSARRLADGSVDLEADSYDLSAGKVVWKASNRRGGDGEVHSILYQEGLNSEQQPTVTVQPGQMVFAVTREEVVMPNFLSGTVYSRNSLAGEGILALNAGHVDPGYRGQIMIRLINLRASPWTLTLGQPIFTIVFQTLEVQAGDNLFSHAPITRDNMDWRVKRTADESMSNALLDLYSSEIDEQLKEHYASVEQRLHSTLTKEFVSRNDILGALFAAAWKWLLGAIVIGATVAAAVFAYLQFIQSN